jgi:LacI family transcriptional regulator
MSAVWKSLMPTIRDVARLAGVSTSTVSLTFSDASRVSKETARTVRQVAEMLGYRPNPVAQSLKRGQSLMFAVVVGDIANPFFTSILKKISAAANKANYQFIISDTNFDVERELTLLSQLDAQKIGGVILTPSRTSDEYSRRLQNLRCPVVLMDQNIPGGQFDFVGTDSRLAASMLTEHLIRLGHTRIAQLSGTAGLWNTIERLEGYRASLTGAGIEIDESLIVDGGYQLELSYQQTMRLLTRPDRPTAILTANNLMGVGAMRAVQELGFRCPEDISLATIDDIPWSTLMRPQLTMIRQDAAAVGGIATRYLFDRMAAGSSASTAPRATVLAPQLSMGNSTAPPKK